MMGATNLDKVAFRKQQIQKMTQMQAQTQAESAQLTQQLFQTSAWQKARSIATTISSPIEVNTRQLITQALKDGKQVLLPKTMPHRQMAFLPFDDQYDRLVVSKFGIPEPAYDAALVNQTPDLVIVPAIAFDCQTRNRIGFGAGYYDRFLAGYHGATVALVPTVMQYDAAQWPLEEHDIKINQLILCH